MPGEREPVHLTVKVEGFVVPAWFGALAGLFAVLGTVALILSLMVNKELSREIRVLQIHTRDIETVLIRERLGTAADFAPWTARPPREPATLAEPIAPERSEPDAQPRRDQGNH